MLTEEILNRHRAMAVASGSDPAVVDTEAYRESLANVLRNMPRIKACLVIARNYESRGQTRLAAIYRRLAREV